MATITGLDFLSTDPIDKIVQQGTVTVTNDGATNQAPQTSKIVESTVTNNYGKAVFCRYMWSVDGTNYNGADTHLVYSYTLTNGGGSSTLGGLKAAVSVGVSASTITFRTANGLHGNVSDDGVTYTYTPTSQTFTIKYALFEID